MQDATISIRDDSAARYPAVLAALFLLILVTSWVGLRYSATFDHIAPIWSAGGLLLAFLLLQPVRRWTGLLGVGLAGFALAHILIHSTLLDTAGLSCCDVLEAAVAGILLKRPGYEPANLTKPRELLRFALFGVVAGPAVSAALATLLMWAEGGISWTHTFLWWYLPDALGMATVTPVALALFHGETAKMFSRGRRGKTLSLFALLAAVSLLSFWRNNFALDFLIYPPLLYVVLELGWAGGAIGVCIVAAIATTRTALRYGALSDGGKAGLLHEFLLLQAFVATTILSVNLVSLIFHERKRLAEISRENERRFRLLAENAHDVIILTNLEGQRLYVSPAVTPILGWSPRDLVGGSYHQDVVHPDDRNLFREALEEVQQLDRGRTIVYRCRKKGGMYVWIEASVNLYRDSSTGEPIGFVNVARDVSQRKAAEEELQNAYETLETLATVDALTGVANRRRFDDALDLEWRRAIRRETPTALLLIDVDHFKSYNDLYGHVRGDSCLRQIAEAAKEVVRRSADVVARFGGEEFAVILPDTDAANAAVLAEEIRTTVMQREITHAGNGPGMVTVSIGCASMIPARGSGSISLVEAADEALYRAKHEGRNRVETAAGQGVGNRE